MSSEGEVTRLLHSLKNGDRKAAQPLWEEYYLRLVAVARSRLRGLRQLVDDEDDIVLSAFASFCRRAEEGKFPKLEDRHDLWQILVMIAERKAYDLIQHEGRARRDFRRLRPLDSPDVENVFVREPDPATGAQMAENFERLLALLPEERLRTIALLKLQAYTNREIAKKINRAVSTVELQLKIIRKHWERELPPASES